MIKTASSSDIGSKFELEHCTQNGEHLASTDDGLLDKESNRTRSETEDQGIVISEEPSNVLIYGIEDVPPIHITIISAIQQALLSLSGQLVVSLLVADVVCAANNEAVKARLLSSTLFMSGITTLCMTILGVRLPLFQGAAGVYIVPLIMMGGSENFCTGTNQDADNFRSTVYNSTNGTLEIDTTDPQSERIWNNIRSLQGSLMVAGVIHALVGATGLVGFLLRFIGPLTVVPALMLMFVFFVGAMLKFVEANWIIAMSTVSVAVILSLYLTNHKTPIPVWTPSGGFRIIRYPLHQIFAILISVLINWMICGILTAAGVFTGNPSDIGYTARTDARAQIISDNPWVIFPYPGQYGAFGYSTGALIGYLVATLMSILDSVGDYIACARASRVPVPPPHAVNRGIMIEGLCTFLSGAVGCGHATSTYGGNIGAISITKVASRRVFVVVGMVYVLFGVFGKFSAVFITIPYPVLGGAIIVLFGIFFGVVVSNLQVVKLSSSRNVAVLGLSVFVGLLVPNWVKKTKNPVNTGNEDFDRILEMLLGNPNLVGTLVACFLDNTVPGTKEERGIAAWQAGATEDASKLDASLYEAGYEVYQPLLPRRLLQWTMAKYIPFLPFNKRESRKLI